MGIEPPESPQIRSPDQSLTDNDGRACDLRVTARRTVPMARIRFPLMSDRKHPHLILWDDESVQRDVARLAEGNHELSNVACTRRRATGAQPGSRRPSGWRGRRKCASGFSLARNSKARSRWDSARAE